LLLLLEAQRQFLAEGILAFVDGVGRVADPDQVAGLVACPGRGTAVSPFLCEEIPAHFLSVNSSDAQEGAGVRLPFSDLGNIAGAPGGKILRLEVIDQGADREGVSAQGSETIPVSGTWFGLGMSFHLAPQARPCFDRITCDNADVLSRCEIERAIEALRSQFDAVTNTIHWLEEAIETRRRILQSIPPEDWPAILDAHRS
jgi:hypothetical protein